MAHFLKARFKGHELKCKVTAGVCELDSETLYFLTFVTPASFYFTLLLLSLSLRDTSLCWCREVKFTICRIEPIVLLSSSNVLQRHFLLLQVDVYYYYCSVCKTKISLVEL